MGVSKFSKYLGSGITNIFETYEAISERQVKSNELGISSRMLNYYKTHDLLFHNTKYEKHDHIIFNFVEFVWFQMILDLRRFDVGLSVIKEIKELLETTMPFDEFMKEAVNSEELINKLPDDVRGEFLDMMHNNFDWAELEREVPITLLSMIISEAIVKRKQTSLLVNPEGEIYPFSLEDFNELTKVDEVYMQFLAKSYVSISITEIIKKFITNFDLKVSSTKLMLLTEREAQIIGLLHNNKLESITIHLDDNRSIRLIETQESYDKLDKESRLLDLIIKNGYQSIEIKTQDGKIVYCKNTKRMKPDN
jgi:DNA-binding transcriptional MerR regulator